MIRPIRGYIKLKMPWDSTQQNHTNVSVHHDAIGPQWEELTLKTAMERPGEGKGESMDKQLSRILDDYLQKNYKTITPIQVSRHGPFEHGGYTWSITFPPDVYDVPLVQASVDGFNPFTDPRPLQYANIAVDRVPQPKLHGYHLALEVKTKTDEQN